MSPAGLGRIDKELLHAVQKNWVMILRIRRTTSPLCSITLQIIAWAAPEVQMRGCHPLEFTGLEGLPKGSAGEKVCRRFRDQTRSSRLSREFITYATAGVRNCYTVSRGRG